MSKASARRATVTSGTWPFRSPGGGLRHQPTSELTRWYNRKYGWGSSRQRKIGIVALARRLLIELWRYLETGAIPEGATVRGEA